MKHKPQSDNKNRQSDGFTLLEMLVVLTIIGLISAVSLPRLATLYSSVETATQKDDLSNQLKLLSFKAYQRSEAFSLQQATQNTDLLMLPTGWHLISGKSIHYSAMGVCSGGEAVFQSEKSLVAFRFTPPLCVPRQI